MPTNARSPNQESDHRTNTLRQCGLVWGVRRGSFAKPLGALKRIVVSYNLLKDMVLCEHYMDITTLKTSMG